MSENRYTYSQNEFDVKDHMFERKTANTHEAQVFQYVIVCVRDCMHVEERESKKRSEKVRRHY